MYYRTLAMSMGLELITEMCQARLVSFSLEPLKGPREDSCNGILELQVPDIPH